VASFVPNKAYSVDGVIEAIESNRTVKNGKAKRYTNQGESSAIHYYMDAQGRIFALVTTAKYEPRVAFQAIEELRKNFVEDFAPRVANATDESLSKLAKDILKNIVDTYRDPAEMDVLASVNEKLDVAKSTMKENINQALANTEKAEHIEEQAVHLNIQANTFKNTSKQLHDKMWWKMWKTRLAIGFAVVVVLIIIIVPIAVTAGKAQSVADSAAGAAGINLTPTSPPTVAPTPSSS